MNNDLEIRDRSIVCDGGNNPPSTAGHTLNIDVRIKIGAKLGHYALRLPIDLHALEEGTLFHVPVIGLGDLEGIQK